MRSLNLLSFMLTWTSVSCYSQCPENNIVLINTGAYSKKIIANEIEVINRLNPKVISIDVEFPVYIGDSNDRLLSNALNGCKKLVLPSQIHSGGVDYYDKEMISIYMTTASEFFPFLKAKNGFVSAKKGNQEYHLPKQFSVWQESYTRDIYYHFSVVTAREFDSLKTEKFIKNHERIVDVELGNEKRKFKIFSSSEVLNGKLSGKEIEGKIVIIGFLGPGMADKFHSPFNTNSNEPDMYGVEYLANITAQILEDKTK